MGKETFCEQYIALRYEDLLAQPWEQMSRLWAFLGVKVDLPDLPEILQTEMDSNPDRDWQQQKAGVLVSPLDAVRGQSGSWRELFTERDKTIFQHVAGEVLEAWGYKW